MKQIYKRLLALVLCISVLAGIPISMSVSANNADTAKQALVSAWQAIANETTKKAIQIGGPNVSSPKEVTAQTTVEGLDDVTKLGSHYVWQDPYAANSHVFIKRTNLTNTNDYDEVYFYLNVYDENKQPISANVTTYVQNTYWIDTTVDGWTKVLFKKADANISAGIRFHSGNANVKYISYGSLWGVKDVSGPALPDNYQSMTLAELVAAAKEINCEGFNGTANFKAALANAENEALKEALVSAWQAIANETTKKAIQIGGPNVSSPKEVTAQTTVEGLDDVTKLGSHYVWQDPYAANAHVFIKRTNLTNTNDYDEVYFYLNFYDANKQPISANVTTYVQNTYWIDTTVDGWTKVPFKKADANISAGIRFHSGNANVKYISYGSLWGVKDVNGPALPDNYQSMTLAELVAAAKEINCEGFDSTENFQKALTAADKSGVGLAKSALIDAWSKLVYEEATVLAYPEAAVPIENVPELAGLTAAEKAKFGSHITHCTQKATAFEWGEDFFFENKPNNYYDKITISFYNTTVSQKQLEIKYKLVKGDGEYNYSCYPWTNAATNITELNVSARSDFAGYLDWSIKGGGVGLGNNDGDVYIGSTIGWKRISEELPENAYGMTLKELYKAAEKLDISKYTEGAGNFEYALAVAQDASIRNELIDAWNELVYEEATILSYPQAAVPIENVAELASLTAEQKARFGSHIMHCTQKATSFEWGEDFFFENKPNNYYDKITISFYNTTVSQKQLEIKYKLTKGEGEYNYSCYPWTNAASNITELDVSARSDFAGYLDWSIKGGGVGLGNNDGDVYIGSTIGWKKIRASAPENAASMSIKELYEAAAKIDISTATEGVEKFKTALADAQALFDVSYELKDQLIAEWKKLTGTATVQVGVPAENANYTANRKQVDGNTTVAGLDDVSKLGTHYLDNVSKTAAYAECHFFHSKDDTLLNANTFSSFKELYFYACLYDANGDVVSSAMDTYINNASRIATSVNGWTKVSYSTALENGFGSFRITANAKAISTISFGSLWGTYTVKADIPDNVEDMAFIDVVEAAEACDVSKFDATAFNAVLNECKQLIADRKQSVIDAWDATGEDKPANINSMTAEELCSAAQELDTNDSDFANAVWSLYILTNYGAIVDEFSDIYNQIADLPENYKLLTPEEWIAAAEALDLSAVSAKLQEEFAIALENLKDPLTKGKADKTELEALLAKANQMNYYDFTAASWAPFGEARDIANALLQNYDNSTQKQIDVAAQALLDVWGGLRMYVRTQWFDFMDYFLKTNPDLSMYHADKTTSTTCIAQKVELPNGANAALVVSNQPSSWSDFVCVYGENLDNIVEHELIEIWYKADPEKPKTKELLIQLVTEDYKTAYSQKLAIPEEAIDGEWHRFELPISGFKNDNDSSKVFTSENMFFANVIRIVSTSGEGNYMIGNFAIVETKAVTAGEVPEVPKMKVTVRQEVVYEPPKNPFTGVDRGDPWGRLEKANKPKKEETKEETPEILPTSKPNTNDAAQGTVLEAQGTCGEALEWKFYSDGKLIISGSGDMENFEEMAPWVAEGCDVLTVEFEGDITSIGDSAFYGCKNLKEIDIPATVTKIGNFAFYECESLKAAKLSDKVEKVGAYSFGYAYDAETGTAVLIDGFKLDVVKPSAAYDYARNYEVKFDIYEDNTEASVVDTAEEEPNNWWIWLVVGAGAVVALGAVAILVIIKSKKNKAEV